MAEQDPPQGGDQPGDATWTAYSPPVSQPYPETPSEPVTSQALPPTHVPYGSPQASSGTYPSAPGSSGVSVAARDLATTAKRGCGVIAFACAAVVIGALVFGAVVVVKVVGDGVGGLDSGLDDAFSAPQADVHSTAGFAELVAAVRDETGSSMVLDIVAYPEYAVLNVPADPTSKRYHSYYYDGELRRTGQGTSDDTRYDLAEIDAAVLVELVQKAELDLVEDPSLVYAIIRSPREFDEGAWFSVYASNDYTESGYFTADRTGAVLKTFVND